MKKIIGLLLCVVIMIISTGCEDNALSGRNRNQAAGVKDVIEAAIAEENSKNARPTPTPESMPEMADNSRQSGINADAPEPANKPETVQSQTEVIDVDLTSLSSTMVYSEVYYMMVMPEEYIGKTIKMDGLFSLYHDETTDKDYFFCIVEDATACCAQGIEFELTDDYAYPDDYPKEGDEICVVGVFDTYDEGEYTYCTLRNAVMENNPR